MTTELPITAMLENEIQKWEDIFYCTRVWDAWNYGTMTRNDFETFSETECFDEIMEKVRTLEESSQKKAKEEERERTITYVVGILEEMKNLKIDNITWDYASKEDMKRCSIEVDIIDEAIARINLWNK